MIPVYLFNHYDEGDSEFYFIILRVSGLMAYICSIPEGNIQTINVDEMRNQSELVTYMCEDEVLSILSDSLEYYEKNECSDIAFVINSYMHSLD